ncbi:hypothetical protein M514_00955 [Trichuris suis]|uniref:Uncharacterized protein n=1 Tax=Trichuris suis TaxID=68888 RepID=A0A085MLU6_9BILA|nr:hypothetical protein M513_00955 [Trichuris suis]KFD70455.1 hypothetical protein M514_00955 [Trichuris suis]
MLRSVCFFKQVHVCRYEVTNFSFIIMVFPECFPEKIAHQPSACHGDPRSLALAASSYCEQQQKNAGLVTFVPGIWPPTAAIPASCYSIVMIDNPVTDDP